jgi:hypothetical protein
MADATTSTTTNATLPAYLDPYVNDLLARSQALTGNSPAPVYGGDRVAGLTAGQQQIGQGLSGLNAGAMISQGGNYTPSTGAFGLEAAQQYMNPYQQAVTDISKREAQRDYDVSQTSRNAKAAQAGAFGGSRQAIVDAEADRNLGTRLSDLQTQGLNSSWQQAQQQYNADQTRQQQDRQFGSQANIAGGKALLGAQQEQGALEQGTAQRGLDTQYQDWLGQQSHPYDQLKFMKGMVSGFPGTSTTQTETAKPASNWASNLGGIMSGIGGVSSIFGWAGGGQVQKRHSGLGAGRTAQLYGSLK